MREGGTLQLPAGRYDFTSLEVKSGGKIHALGAVDVRVAWVPIFREGTFVGPQATAATAGSFLLAAAGLQASSGATSRLLLVAPAGLVTWAEHATLTGAMAARAVELCPQARVTSQDGFSEGGVCACDDGSPCTEDTCGSGVCTHAPVATGTSCSDGNVCNGAEVCSALGVCQAGSPPTLDDGNPCTNDGCSPTNGISHTPVSAGTACADGNVCNGAETCNATGSCVAGTAPSLDDGNPCTADACDAVAGVTHTPVSAGTK